ncbi:MAG: hypothetical protein LBC80_02165 [Treponema sp.]|jgi:hypothetical protein|nr:hypothetical protein [Treponema sp.]
MQKLLVTVGLFLIFTAFAASQELPDQIGRLNRGSVPEVLIRPNRSESARYPIDTVIGELGQGQAPRAAYNFANSICDGLLSLNISDSALSSINSALRENFLSMLQVIDPVNYRIGGGREEADGAVSFLVRFIGRDYAISGELYIRLVTRENAQGDRIENWVFDELLLEEAKSREVEQRESIYRYDFNPFERFF